MITTSVITKEMLTINVKHDLQKQTYLLRPKARGNVTQNIEKEQERNEGYCVKELHRVNKTLETEKYHLE